MNVSGREDLKRLIQKVNRTELASVKNSIIEIINVVNDPLSNAKQLTEIIELDPPLTGKILRVANSPYYSSIRKISDIRQAIIRIGFDIVKELTLSQKVCELFAGNQSSVGFSRLELWKHSVAVALCAKLIYRKEFGLSGALAFTAGILHDLGIIVEDQFLQSQFSEIIFKKKMMKDNILNAENDVLKVNHCIIAEDLLIDWGVPKALIESVKNHHNPNNVSEDNYKIAATLYVADYLVQNSDIGFSDTPFLNKLLFEKTLKKLNVPQLSVDIIIEEVKEEIQKMQNEGWFDEI